MAKRTRDSPVESKITPAMRDEIGLLTPQDVADLLQVSIDWVYDQASMNKMPHLRLGRHVRFRAADLKTYLDGNWTPPPPKSG